MKRKYVVVVLLSSIALPGLALSTPAGEAAIVAAINALTGVVSSGFGTVNGHLIHIKQIIDAHGDKISDTVNNAAQNQNRMTSAVQRENQIRDAEQNTRMPMDPCANASRALSSPEFGFRNPSAAAGGWKPRMGGVGGGGVSHSTGSAQLDKSIQIANGDRPAPAPETQAMAAQMGACEAYGAGDVRKAACTAAGVKSTNSTGLPNADIQSNTLFNGAQSAQDFGKVSMTFNDKQIAATNAYLRNISNPINLRELTPLEAKTDDGRRYHALRDAYQARLDMAMYSSKEYQDRMSPDKNTIPMIQAIIDGGGPGAKFTLKYLSQTAPNWKSTGISYYHMMKLESDRRIRSVEYLVDLAKQDDPLTLQREQILIQAAILDRLTKAEVDVNKSNVLLGSIYQASLNKDFMPELMAQHRRATASR